MMVSYRKKYSPQVESPPRDNDDAPVVASPRPSAAAPPATAVDHPEPPVLEERPPEEVAAKNAIQERLREMTEAEAHARQPVEQRAADSTTRQHVVRQAGAHGPRPPSSHAIVLGSHSLPPPLREDVPRARAARDDLRLWRVAQQHSVEAKPQPARHHCPWGDSRLAASISCGS